MNEQQALAYVKAAATAVALPLDEARAQRVAVHLGRTAVLAAQLDAFDLALSDESAEIFCPAAFPDIRNTSEQA